MHFQENQNPAGGGQGIPNHTDVHLTSSSQPGQLKNAGATSHPVDGPRLPETEHLPRLQALGS